MRRRAIRSTLAAALAVVLCSASILATQPAPAALAVDGSVAGSVYQDFYDDGQRTPPAADFGGDLPMEGVTVTATDSTGAVVGTTTTLADGTYSLPVVGAASADVRVEFTIPDGFRSARVGAQNGSTVQFVQLGATGVDVGMTQEDMVNVNAGVPYVAVAENRGVLDGGANPNNRVTSPTANFANQPSLFGFPYGTSGHPITSGRQALALQGQTGTLWGAANVGTQYVLSGAYFRRGATIGPGGPTGVVPPGATGNIYLTDVATARAGTPNASLLVQIPNAGANPRPNPTPAGYDWLHDPAAFPVTGRVGLGDIEVSSDHRTLYAVNLNDRQLYAVPLNVSPGVAPTAGTPQAIPMPLSLPGAQQGCASDAVRPFGLGGFQGDMYVTLTCTGPTAADLRVYVYAMDEETKVFDSAPVLEVDLTYPRATAGANTLQAGTPYAPWSDSFALTATNQTQAPQPIASSISFDGTGDISLSIKDRSADQYGASLSSTTPGDTRIFTNVFAAGDLLRACGSPQDGWVLENDGTCGTATSTLTTNNWGPGGGQFYNSRFTSNYVHGTTLLGSSIQLPGFDQAMGTLYDANALFSNGIRVLSNSTGASLRNGTLDSTAGEPGTGSFHKSGGLGDLVALIEAAPVEIGNRVWLDLDNDGIQEAGEQPIAGVTVRLYAADGVTLLATAVTDANGNYIFSSSPGTSTGASIYGLRLLPDTNYVIKLDNAADYGPGGPLDGLRQTLTTAGGDTAADSNGVAESPTLTTAAVRTPSPGAADHTFDFGFSPTYSLGNRLWLDTGAGAATNNGAFDAGEAPVVGAVVELLDGAGAPVLGRDGNPITTTTDANGFYRFDGLNPGDYQVRVAASNFQAGGPLADYVSSEPTSSDFDAASNNDDKGIDDPNPAVNGITSSVITLDAANVPASEVDAGATGAGANGPFGDAFDNLTVDFGFVLPFDLTIDKALTSGAGPYRVGDVVTFSITPSNLGPGAAVSGFTVSDLLPDGLEFQSATGTDWSLTDGDGPEVTLTYGGADLAAGAAAPAITVTAELTSTTAGTLRNVTVVEPSPAQQSPELIPVGTSPDRYENGSPTPTATDPSNNDDAAEIPVAEPLLSLGNRLWFDMSPGGRDNGAPDAGEGAVVGATVELLDATGAPVLDASGNPITAVTDASGFYRFDGLEAGDYQVRVAASNFVAGGPLEGFISSTGASADFTAGSNNTDKGQDADDPAATGITSATITLARGTTGDLDAGATGSGDHGPNGDEFDNLTADFGFIRPTVSVGDFVWIDTDRDGQQGDPAAEPGIPDVVLVLTGPDGQPVTDVFGNLVTSVTTDANGAYSFDNLPALPAGQHYTVTIDQTASAAALAPFVPTTENSGDPATDSSTDSAESGDLTTDGARDSTLDFGFVVPSVSVGDYVWVDTDRDGQQGDPAAEPGIEDVVLVLTGPDGLPVTDVFGNLVTSVTTDANGAYSFDNLPALPAGQHYTVTIDQTASAAALAPYIPTTENSGDPATDSSTDSAESGDLTTDGARDSTLDFGFVVPSVSVGDYVWVDTNRDGQQGDPAIEPGIEDVVLVLTGPNGQPVTDVFGNLVPAQTTDANGAYSFDNLPALPAGQHYTVTIDQTASAAALAPYIPTTENSGDPATDSSTDSAESGDLTTDGARDSTLDFGFVLPSVSVGDYVWVDTNRDGQQGDPAVEPGIGGVVLLLTGPDGQPVTDVFGNLVTAERTNPDGSYSFDNLPALPAGQHYTVTIDQTASATALAPYIPTTENSGDPATDSSTDSAESGDLTTDGARDSTLDFGFVVPSVSVGDYVWVDTDRDGQQGDPADEPGIPDVVLVLTGPDGLPVTDVFGNLVPAQRTNADGLYSFDNLPALPAGQHYTVTIDQTASAAALAPYIPTTENSGDPATDSSTDSAESGDLTTDGDRDSTLDFGFVVPSVSVGDYVWVDTNRDGQQGDPADEPGIPDVVLVLTGPDGLPVTDVFGNLVPAQRTNADGLYSFDNLPALPAGEHYTVTIDQTASAAALAPYIPTQENSGDPATDSSTDSAESGDLTTDGARDSTLDFGFVLPSVSVGDYVWVDTDRDGQQGDPAAEPGIPDVVLVLAGPNGQPVTDVFGNLVPAQRTNADGAYSFDNLPALPAGQHYTVTIDQTASATALAPYIPTTENSGDPATDSSTDSAESGDLTTDGARDATLDFGFVLPSVSVGDYVWVDTDRDGQQGDPAVEPGIEDVVLVLTGPNGQPVTDVFGNLVTAQRTDANGAYSFDNLPALPAGQHYTVTIDQTASAAALAPYIPTTENSGDPATDSSTDSAESGDLTTDGARDSTLDFGFVVPSVSVGDYVWVDTDRDGQQGDPATEPGIENVVLVLTGPNGQPVTDVFGNLVPAQTTDANGAYSFDNLPALPAGEHYTVTIDQTASAAALAPYIPTQENSGDPATDSSTDSAESGDLTTDGARDSTLDFGFVLPSVSVGDYVWVDTNRDGQQGDPAVEPGIENVVLLLIGPNGQPVTDVYGNAVGPVTTDANGAYSFDNLPTLPAGQHYTVTIDKTASAAALAPYLPTVANTGDPATDSSTDRAESGDLTVNGARDSTLDFGFVPVLFAVGDYVWFDDDRDGRQDAGEAPVPGMTVTLYFASGDPATDWAGNPIAPVTTDANGRYVFDGLLAGDYYVEFSGVPDGFEFTSQGSGGADDSNAGVRGRTPVFTLGIGSADIRAVESADGLQFASFFNPTIDAGLVRIIVAPAPTPTPTPETLARTGGELPWLWAAFAALLVALGGVALRARSTPGGSAARR